ncbi:hypothetical protein F5I97DRAFT_1879916 [Phlebopus sp. FC_14]|nr:hypothetical protein F5I97DRAFT_1879916 [Phlebopus sp. FC_14]
MASIAQPSIFCRLPLEILENLALELLDDFFTPPSALVPLLLTCKHIHTSLGIRDNCHLYARIFRTRFDETAPLRRLGDYGSSAPGLASQLIAYCYVLKTIRTGDIHAQDVLPTFWSCFSMMMENDGMNRCQLEAAGLPDFVDRFVRQRLYEDCENGWPTQNQLNSLALWLLWFTTTEERLRAETPPQRAQITKLVLPYVLMPVRYAPTIAPSSHFTLPLPHDLAQAPHSFLTVHGPYPKYRDGLANTMSLYQATDLEVGVPLASVAAKLIYFSRREVLPVGHGPTQEDVQELNDYKVAKLIPKTTWDWWSGIKDSNNLRLGELAMRAPSTRWDDDWNRLTDCNYLFEPVSLKRTHYTPGSLTGLWQGRMVLPDDALYANLLQTAQIPPSFNEHTIGLTVTPVFMRLREYHCMDVEPRQPVPSGSRNSLNGGVHNAWFPHSVQFQELSHGLSIRYQGKDYFYNSYVAGSPDLHDETKCRGCQFRGTSEMIFREDDAHYLDTLNQVLAEEPMQDDGDEDEMGDDSSDSDVDMGGDAAPELVVKRKCDGILDIVLVGETDERHGQAWHPYRYYGRVREWDGLVALIRVPVHTAHSHSLGIWIFSGYVVGGQNFVGNWRTSIHPNEPVTFESAFAMSKRD